MCSAVVESTIATDHALPDFQENTKVGWCVHHPSHWDARGVLENWWRHMKSREFSHRSRARGAAAYGTSCGQRPSATKALKAPSPGNSRSPQWPWRRSALVELFQSMDWFMGKSTGNHGFFTIIQFCVSRGFLDFLENFLENVES